MGGKAGFFPATPHQGHERLAQRASICGRDSRRGEAGRNSLGQQSGLNLLEVQGWVGVCPGPDGGPGRKGLPATWRLTPESSLGRTRAEVVLKDRGVEGGATK